MPAVMPGRSTAPRVGADLGGLLPPALWAARTAPPNHSGAAAENLDHHRGASSPHAGGRPAARPRSAGLLQLLLHLVLGDQKPAQLVVRDLIELAVNAAQNCHRTGLLWKTPGRRSPAASPGLGLLETPSGGPRTRRSAASGPSIRRQVVAAPPDHPRRRACNAASMRRAWSGWSYRC